jgi:hypothetical protein
MNISSKAGILTVFLAAVTPVQAADNPGIERLAMCQDSWFEWKSSDPARLQKFVESFQSDFSQKEASDAFFVPKSSQTVAGLPVAQVFPESVGMAVGFSVVVNANFDKTRTSLEKKSASRSKNANPPVTTCAPASCRLARRRPFC